MYHKELVEHIIHQKKIGLPDEVIRKELRNDTWEEEDINLGFYYANHPEALQHFSLKRLLQSEVKASYFALSLLLVTFSFATPLVYSDGELGNTYTITVTDVPKNTAPAFTYGIQRAMSQPDFFNTVKNKFIDTKATFVEVDLTSMIARVYKNGTPILEVPVKTKGKSGSWWETPAGLYKIETKEKTHYSTMGHVTQPWSMQFQGNFFIHGIPYHDDGTQVSSSFSGGCVRLLDDDAKKIFDAVTVGTPILVYEKDFSPDTFTYSEILPNITARSYLYADINNNFVFLKNNESETVEAGAITKLMTALIATEYINIEKTTKVSSDALIDTEYPRLQVGTKIDIYQLLFPLLRESSNEAGETIARVYGRSAFIKHMNEKAKAIGMTHTTFVDPTGVSSKNTTTAEDMFMLAKYIYNNRSFIFNITSGKVKTSTYGESIFDDLRFGNSLHSEKTFFGGISDEQSSTNQYNFSVFEVKNGDITRPLFFVSLHSTDAKNDIREGIEYIRTNYK